MQKEAHCKNIWNGRNCYSHLWKMQPPTMCPVLSSSSFFYFHHAAQHGCCYLDHEVQDHTWQKNKIEMIWYLISTRNFIQVRNKLFCFQRHPYFGSLGAEPSHSLLVHQSVQLELLSQRAMGYSPNTLCFCCSLPSSILISTPGILLFSFFARSLFISFL